MYKSIEDVFNDSNAVYNEPYDSNISNPVIIQENNPSLEEYQLFLDSLSSFNKYPKPKMKSIFHSINPNNGPLESIYT